jgi:membrane protein required for colicin V production
MHLVLGAVLLLLAFFVVQGFREGVIRRVLEIAGLLAIFLFASRLADLLEPRLTRWLSISPTLAFFAAWTVVLLAGVIVVRMVALAMSKLLAFSVIGWLDRLGGAVLGAAFGCFVASCLLLMLVASRADEGFKQEVMHNPVTGRLLRVAPAVYDAARAVWGGEPFEKVARLRLEPALRRAVSGN